MNITRAQLKETLRTIMKEESEYQIFFQKALDKAGKSITDMSDDEKKDFFNKIDAAWDAKGEKNEGNAFGAAVTAAKEAGEDSFEVGGEEYKVEESVNEANVPKMYVTYLAVEKKLRELEAAQKEMAKKYFAEKDAKKKADLLDKMKKGTKVLQYTRKNLSDIEDKYVTGLDKDAELQGEGVVNEITLGQALKSVAKGETTSVEGVKMSRNLANAIANWTLSSPYGKKYGKQMLKAPMGSSWKIILSSAWGVEPYLQRWDRTQLAKVKPELDKIKSKVMGESVNEALVTEATDIYLKGRIQITKFAGPDGLMIQINAPKYKTAGDHIVMANDDFIQILKNSSKLLNQLKENNESFVNEDYNGPAILKLGDKNLLKVGEKITINTNGKKKEYKVVKSMGNGDFVLNVVESVNEETLKQGTKLRYDKNTFVVDYVVDKKYIGKDGFPKYILKVVKSNYPNKIKVGSTEEYEDSKLTGLIRNRVMTFVKNESVNEGRAFINAAKKAKAEGKTEFEFNGKTYPVTIKD